MARMTVKQLIKQLVELEEIYGDLNVVVARYPGMGMPVIDTGMANAGLIIIE
jgi:hypothetical protein